MTDIANLIAELIESMGFPIVACAALFWMINNTMKELKLAINDLSDSIKSITNDKEKGD